MSIGSSVFKRGSWTYATTSAICFPLPEKKYTAGIQQVYWEILGWRLMPLICYDLRFPAWNRNDGSVDLYLYVANWPEKRIAAWDTLLYARAMENMAYVAGVNRVGVDGNGMAHNGSSQVFDVLGHSLGRCPDNQQEALVIDLSMEALAEKEALRIPSRTGIDSLFRARLFLRRNHGEYEVLFLNRQTHSTSQLAFKVTGSS